MGAISRLLALEEEIPHQVHTDDCKRPKKPDGAPACACAIRTFKMSPLTLEIQGAWVQYLKNRAFAELQGVKHLMSTEEYREERGAIIDRFATDQYGLLSANSITAATTQFGEGARHLMFLRIKPNHKDVTDAVIWELIEAKAEEIMFKMDSQDAPGRDPNLATPEKPGAETAGGTPAPAGPSAAS